jgi:CheY-like chemotaxis protein
MLLNNHLDVLDLHLPVNIQDEIRHQIARSEMESGHSSSDRLRRNHILCVDDEIVATATRAEVMRERGYSVVVYHSPFAVLDCDLSRFNLAIVDFQMPGLNGRELFLRLRALGAAFPVVLLTGCLDTLSRDGCVLFARCIDKGMPIHRLLDVIAEFLDPNPIPDYEP